MGGPDVFASDAPNNGAAPIGNNLSERETKRIVLNRKNSVFVGRERGGATAATLASVTSACRRHDIDLQRCLTQLLTNLPDASMSTLDHWLPNQCKTANPDPASDAGA